MDQIDADIKALEMDGVKVRRPQPNSPAANQLHYFAEQEKIRYRLPRNAGEPRGSYETFIVNDLMITVEKGVSVTLPEDIAEGFDKSQAITDNAIQRDALKELPAQLQN